MLLSKEDIHPMADQLPDWAPEVFDTFVTTVTGQEPPFPCVFARHALGTDGLRFACLQSPEDPADLAQLVDVVAHYAAVSRGIRPWTTLVALFGPEDERRTLHEHRARFWRVMQHLHDHDPAPWPAGAPTDPDDPDWEFAFAGERMFVVGSAPVYHRRVSRNTATFTMLFQPRWMFDEMIAGPKFDRTTAAIRRRQERYDGMASHPSILTFGDPANREWRQYVIPDDNDPVPGRCPLHFTRSG
jgi:FPC/CPF motif-containing protein YcgG